MFKIVDDGRADGRWMTDAWLYCKLTYEPEGSGELKRFVEKLYCKSGPFFFYKL